MDNNNKDFFLLRPDWRLPEGVHSAITMRSAGITSGQHQPLQCPDLEGDALAGLEDDAEDYLLGESREEGLKQSAHLRGVLARQLGANISVQWLDQVHGARVIEASFGNEQPEADACYSRAENLACAVMTADCLPVLITALDGAAVAAVHAGWRGLAAGVVSAAIKELGVEPAKLSVYLGPAICAHHFEVGAEVLSAFLEKTWVKPLVAAGQLDRVFQASRSRPGHYHADLYRLARLELGALGVREIYGGGFCSYGQPRWFYSHRRGRDVGRTASLIWIESS